MEMNAGVPWSVGGKSYVASRVFDFEK